MNLKEGMQGASYGGYPDVYAPRAIKRSKKFGVQMFTAMYNDWAGDNEAQLERWTRTVAENRKYSMGSQSVNKYKQMFSNEGGDLSFMTLDWSIVPIIPKFVDILVNGAMNKDHRPRVEAIDATSQEERRREKYKKKTNLLLKEFTQDISALTGVDMSAYMKDLPETDEELDLWMELNYKQASEVAMEQGIEFAFSYNDFREVFKRVCRDLVDIAKGATRTKLTKEGLQIHYVDPAYFVHSFTNDPTAKNMVHAGEIRFVTIGELRNQVEEDVPEEVWLKIAKSHAGENGNPSKVDRVKYFPDTDTYNIDKFKVRILEGEFRAYDHDLYERKYTKYGTYTFNFKDDDYTPPKNPRYKRELVKDEYDVWYEGTWVIGTDYCFDYGVKENMVRKTGSLHRAKCSYSLYQLSPVDGEIKSMVERMRPFADQIQLAHLKLAQHVAKARPRGAVYMLDYMENIPKGDGGTMTPLDVQDIHNQTGNLYARLIDDEGKPVPFSFQELEGGVGRALQEFITVYNYNLERIRDVTGLNEQRDGSKPDKDSLVGVQRIALEASNNATRHIDDGLGWIMKDTAESVVLMMQHIIKYKSYYKDIYETFIASIGDTSMSVIESLDELPAREFGLFIDMAPDAIEKEYLEQNIKTALSNGSIELEDASEVRRIRNVKLAEQRLRVIREKRRKEKLEEARQNSEMNAMVQERSAAAKAQSDAQVAQAKAQAKIQELQAEYQLKAQLENQQHDNKMKELEYTEEMKLKHIMAADDDRQADLTRVRTT